MAIDAQKSMLMISYRAAMMELATCSAMRHAIPVLAALFSAATLAQECPLDPAARIVVRLHAAELAGLQQAQRVQRRTLTATQAAQPVLEQSVRYSGVLLRDLLARTLPADNVRAARTMVVEAVATDGYRAVFSWGEIFNSSAGEQVLIIREQDGQPLGSEQGPLALRALGDLRPGPRHVRNLCGVMVR